MALTRKSIVLALGAAALGCAAQSYAQSYEYSAPDPRYHQRADYGPAYPYAAQSIEPGFTYTFRDRYDRRDSGPPVRIEFSRGVQPAAPEVRLDGRVEPIRVEPSVEDDIARGIGARYDYRAEAGRSSGS